MNPVAVFLLMFFTGAIVASQLYRANFLNLTRCGTSSLTPSRSFLPSS